MNHAQQVQTRGRSVKMLIALAVALVLSCTAVSAGQAAKYVWVDVPNWGAADADAIIDASSSGSASGRVWFNPSGVCRRVEYAPYAIFGVDGGWNRLPTSCANGYVTQYWSDRFHIQYNGFKFRICGATGCGGEVRIRFW